MTQDPRALAVGPERGMEAVARQYPDRVAIELPGGAVTYGELDDACNRLAQRLLDEAEGEGLREQACVPIMVDGTEALLVAAEAVHRAGMVAVPVDPNTPDDRIEHIVRTVRARFVLSDGLLGTMSGTRCLHPLSDGVPVVGPVRRPPGRLGSVVFTSGSTGLPKGVMTRPTDFSSLADLVSVVTTEGGPVRLGMVMAGSVAASIPIAELVVTFGFTLVPFEIRHQAQEVGKWLLGSGVKVYATVPTMVRQLVTSLAPGDVIEGLDFLGLFGESTTWEDVAQLRAHLHPGAVIFNIYGQSEAGDIAVMAVGSTTPIGEGPLPVGAPLAGRQVTVEDELGNVLPPGQRGEIVVRSRATALGYWDDETETSRVFSPQADGTVLVRTGDVGRFTADGLLEHLGRLDHMVKVAGNRVDLLEVEACLRSYPWVADAVACTYAGPGGELRLRAFVVMEPGRIGNPRALRGWLVRKLARPAVPDAVEILDELPRLPNGKVDRGSLPSHPPRLRPATVPAVLPGELESRLVGVWAEVLGFEDVAGHDDFFDLGGDSLRAVALMAGVAEVVGRDVPLSLLLEHPTPRAMAVALADGPSARPVVTMQARVDGLPVFVVPDAHGSLFGARNYLDALELDQPIYGLRATAWEEGADLEQSLEALAGRYCDDICSAQPRGAVCIYGQDTAAVIAFEVARQLYDRGRTVALLVLGSVKTPGTRPWAVARQRLAGLAAVPANQRKAELGRLAKSAQGYFHAAAGRKVDAVRRRRSQAQANGTAPDTPLTERTQRVHAYYLDLVRNYRAPGKYRGAALVAVPQWVDEARVRRWSHWLDGPVRYADPVEVVRELAEAETRALERLAP